LIFMVNFVKTEVSYGPSYFMEGSNTISSHITFHGFGLVDQPIRSTRLAHSNAQNAFGLSLSCAGMDATLPLLAKQQHRSSIATIQFPLGSWVLFHRVFAEELS